MKKRAFIIKDASIIIALVILATHVSEFSQGLG